jgi:hypothetical protein
MALRRMRVEPLPKKEGIRKAWDIDYPLDAVEEKRDPLEERWVLQHYIMHHFDGGRVCYSHWDNTRD